MQKKSVKICNVNIAAHDRHISPQWQQLAMDRPEVYTSGWPICAQHAFINQLNRRERVGVIRLTKQ